VSAESTKRFVPNPEREKQRRALKDYFSKQPDGAVCSWLEIEQSSGVSMHPASSPGRNLVRHVLRAAGRPWLASVDGGVELVSADNATDVSAVPMRRLSRAYKRAAEVQTEILERVGDKLPTSARQLVESRSATLRTIVEGFGGKLLKG
jgi:hypothetical protein